MRNSSAQIVTSRMFVEVNHKINCYLELCDQSFSDMVVEETKNLHLSNKIL